MGSVLDDDILTEVVSRTIEHEDNGDKYSEQKMICHNKLCMNLMISM